MAMDPVSKEDAIDRAELHRRLLDWLVKFGHESRIDGLIRDEEVVGVRALVHIADGGQTYQLNADTTRAAVGAYLEMVIEHGRDLPWVDHPTERRAERRTVCRQMVGPSASEPITSFFLYRQL